MIPLEEDLAHSAGFVNDDIAFAEFDDFIRKGLFAEFVTLAVKNDLGAFVVRVSQRYVGI